MSIRIFFTCLILSYVAQAQEGVDALRSTYNGALGKTEKVGVGLKLLDEYYYTGQLEEGIRFAKELFTLADSNQRSIEVSKIYNRLGTLYTELGNHDIQALRMLNKSLSISLDIDWKLGANIAYNNLGNVYRDLGYYTKAHELYTKSLAVCEEIKDSAGIGYAFKNLGILAEDQGWEAKALEYHHKAYAIRKKIGNDREILASLHSIGIVLNKIKRYEEANNYLLVADSLARKSQSEIQPEISLELGDSYAGLMKFNEALTEYDHGLTNAKRSGKRRAIANLLIQKTILMLKNKQLKQAKEHLTNVRLHLDTVRYVSGRIQLYFLSYQIDSMQGNELGALRNFRKMTLLQDSLSQLSSTEEMMLKQSAFDLMQKDAMIELEREKQKFQRKRFSIIAVLLVISIIGLATTVFVKVRSTRKINEKRREIIRKNSELETKNNELAHLISVLREAEEKIHQQNEEIRTHNEQLVLQVKNRTDQIIATTSQVAQFGFMVSHNLRGPVARILGLRNLLRIAPKQEEINMVLTKLDESIGEVDQIINDISRVLDTEAGVKAKIELIDTQLMMKEVTTVLGSEINHTGAEIRWEVSAVPFVFSSVHFLKSALEQLVLNSLKFRDESRKLIVMITAVKSDHVISFSVEDNGIGLDLNKYGQEVFMPYKRFHTHRTGRGFGLFLIKHRIELLGGTISIDSRINEFTNVTFTLPVG